MPAPTALPRNFLRVQFIFVSFAERQLMEFFDDYKQNLCESRSASFIEKYYTFIF